MSKKSADVYSGVVSVVALEPLVHIRSGGGFSRNFGRSLPWAWAVPTTPITTQHAPLRSALPGTSMHPVRPGRPTPHKQHTICFNTHYNEASPRSMCLGRNLEKRLSGAVAPNFGALMAAYQKPQEEGNPNTDIECECNNRTTTSDQLLFHLR